MVHFIEAVVRLAVLVLHRISNVSESDDLAQETRSVYINDTISFYNGTFDLPQFDRQILNEPPEIPCPNLLEISGPYVEFPVPQSCTSSVPPGTRCNIGCLPNYELVGSCSRVCYGNGQWSGYESQCINRNIRCPDLQALISQSGGGPINGRRKRQATVPAIIEDPLSCLPFAGSVCQLRCPINSFPQGRLRVACLENGQLDSPPTQCSSTGFPPTQFPPQPTFFPTPQPTFFPPTQFPPQPTFYPQPPATFFPPTQYPPQPPPTYFPPTQYPPQPTFYPQPPATFFPPTQYPPQPTFYPTPQPPTYFPPTQYPPQPTFYPQPPATFFPPTQYPPQPTFYPQPPATFFPPTQYPPQPTQYPPQPTFYPTPPPQTYFPPTQLPPRPTQYPPQPPVPTFYPPPPGPPPVPNPTPYPPFPPTYYPPVPPATIPPDPPVTVVPTPPTRPPFPTIYPPPPSPSTPYPTAPPSGYPTRPPFPTQYPTPPTFYPTPPTFYPTRPTYYPPPPTQYPPYPSTCSPGCRPVDSTPPPSTDPTIGPPLKCFDLNPPSFGSVSGQCVNAFFGQSCTYKCNPGYGLVGASVLTCGTDGWSSSAPVCLPILCRNQTAPAHGRLEGACSPGFGGTSCTLICDLGYKITGLANDSDVTSSITIGCNNDRNWAREFPLCTPITCPSLPSLIPNGAMQPGSQCSPGIALKLCSYQCQRGYAITGSASALLCQLDGTFSAEVPTCTRILCPGIRYVPNAMVSGQCSPGYAYEKCTITCNPGFRPSVQEIECQANGTFSAEIIPCQRIPCPPLSAPNAISQSGVGPWRMGTGGMEEDTMNYTSNCMPGYALGTCYIRCKPGYIFNNASILQTIQCDANGTWIGAPERCREIYCKPKRQPKYSMLSQGCTLGTYSSQCIIKCPKNYEFYINGTKSKSVTLDCSIFGQWEGGSGWPAVDCTRKKCAFTNVTIPIENGKRMGLGCSGIGSQLGLAGECCTYSCEAGYALRGTAVVNCVDNEVGDAQFDIYDPTTDMSQLPECVIVYCPSPLKVPDNFGTDCQGNRVYQKCVITSSCEPPLAPSIKEITCNANGNWSESLDQLTCTGDQNLVNTDCMFEAIENGVLSPGCSPGYIGFTCNINCNSGFRPFRNGVRKCTSTGWDDPSKPICIPQLCPGITVPLNADASGQCAPGIPTQACTIICRPGYKIEGRAATMVTLNCLDDGMFDSPTPRCVRITCPPLTPPQGGSMSGACSPGSTGDACFFSCPPGFRLNGRPSIVCTETGNWSGQVPVCLSPDGRQPNPIPGQSTLAPTNRPGPTDGASYTTARPATRPNSCRPRKICCPFLLIRKPFLTVNCHGISTLFLPEAGTSCTLRCTRGELIDGSSRPQRRKIINGRKQNDQRQEFFTKKLLYLICSRNSNWIGGDINQIRCANGYSATSDSSSYPNNHPERSQVHVRPWFNVKTNETRLVASDH